MNKEGVLTKTIWQFGFPYLCWILSSFFEVAFHGPNWLNPDHFLQILRLTTERIDLSTRITATLLWWTWKVALRYPGMGMVGWGLLYRCSNCNMVDINWSLIEPGHHSSEIRLPSFKTKGFDVVYPTVEFLFTSNILKSEVCRVFAGHPASGFTEVSQLCWDDASLRYVWYVMPNCRCLRNLEKNCALPPIIKVENGSVQY